MPEPSDFISQEQYDQYKDSWLTLLNGGDANDLQQAFLAPAPDVARMNFATFSIDQILELVTADGADCIKARFLLIPDSNGQLRFSIALFTVDANDDRLTEYYVPAQAAATTAQAVGASAAATTQITPEVAMRWLTAWVSATTLTIAEFTTPHGSLHGCNFEISTFQDPLAGARPYDDKCLFLNYGLSTEAGATLIALVVYIGRIGSRTQGSLAGIPADAVFYDSGSLCPPAH